MNDHSIPSLRCILSFLVVLAFGCGQAFGQKPSASDSGTAAAPAGDPRVLVPQLLGSNIPQARAWGAYLSGQNHLVEFIPQLLGELDRHIADDGIEQRLLCQCVLDSLIQLDAAIPSDLLQPIFDRYYRAEAIILASNSTSGLEPNLLNLMQENLTDAEWLAIGNILSEAKAPEFAASLLREIKINVSVFVVDDASQGYGSGFGIGSGKSQCGGGGLRMPEGFPPVAYYLLTTYPERKTVSLGPGPHPVYYERDVMGGPYGYPRGSGNSGRERDRYRVEYIAAMLNTSVEALHFDLYPNHNLVFRDGELFKHELNRIRKKAADSYQRLTSSVVAARLAKENEIAPPNISITVNDMREDKSIPLPNLQGVEVQKQ